MMINKRDVATHNIARFNAENVWGTMSARIDGTTLPISDAHATATSRGPTALRYITTADRAYIADDLSKPVVRDIFASTVDQRPTSRIDWEGIAIGAFLVGYLVLAGMVLFKVAAFGSTFASQSAWRILDALQP